MTALHNSSASELHWNCERGGEEEDSCLCYLLLDLLEELHKSMEMSCKDNNIDCVSVYECVLSRFAVWLACNGSDRPLS